MSNVLEYNGFIGSVEFSLEDHILFGSLLYINDLVTYEGETLQELEEAFQEAVEEYIELCKECEKEPEKPFKGVFNVRISPELHKRAVYEAERRGVKLNQFVMESIKNELESRKENKEEHKHMINKIDEMNADFNNNFSALSATIGLNNFILSMEEQHI